MVVVVWWCFCGGAFYGGGVVVFLWCFCGGGVVVGGVFVVVWWCFFVVV